MKIDIARDFSETPGGRYMKDGKHSGEQFLIDFILPGIMGLNKGENLIIDFDGTYGYPIGFLDQAFGMLVRMFRPYNIMDRIDLISKEDTGIINIIEDIVKENRADADSLRRLGIILPEEK